MIMASIRSWSAESTMAASSPAARHITRKVRLSSLFSRHFVLTFDRPMMKCGGGSLTMANWRIASMTFILLLEGGVDRQGDRVDEDVLGREAGLQGRHEERRPAFDPLLDVARHAVLVHRQADDARAVAATASGISLSM